MVHERKGRDSASISCKCEQDGSGGPWNVVGNRDREERRDNEEEGNEAARIKA